MYALRTNTYIWKSNFNKQIDKYLRQNNVTIVDLPWRNFDLKNDNNHFTWEGFKNFSNCLCKKIKNKINSNSSVYIISDSTIDYWNYDNKGNYTERGNNYIKSTLNISNITIDAIGGSGFYALKDDNKNFTQRLKMLKCKYDYILFIGGWNDNNFRKTIKEIKKSINICKLILK